MQFPFVSRKALDAVQEKYAALEFEYQNYRRRNVSVKDSACQEGILSALSELLPVYDNLTRALQQPCQDAAFVSGIEMTLSSMKQSLARLGVEEIPAEGQAFDPSLHEAMDHIEDSALGENMVASVVLTGFRRGDCVLRHALVIVAN